MRPIFSQQEELTFENQTQSLKIVKEYQNELNEIAKIINQNPKIVKSFHQDVLTLGSTKGSQAPFSSEQLFLCLQVKSLFGLSYRETVIRIATDATLRNFTKIFSGPMVDFSFLCKANKAIENSTWENINRCLSKYAQDENLISGECLRVDSTVIESNIHYPTDSHLLWDGFNLLNRFYQKNRAFYLSGTMKLRFHEAKIKRAYQFISRNAGNKSKATKKKVLKKYKYLINQTKRICHECSVVITQGLAHNGLSTVDHMELTEIKHYIDVAQKVICQTESRIIDGITTPSSEKIYSIFESHTEMIMKGKSGKPREFGHMATFAQTKERFISFYKVDENKIDDTKYTSIVLEDHKNTFGIYPEVFAADKGYWENPETTKKWREEIKTFSIGKKGKRTESERELEHSSEFKEAQKFRSGVEASISTLKHQFSLKRCLLKGFKKFETFVASGVFSYNLVLLMRRRLAMA
jgi:transposase, IS5 family